MIFIFAPCTLWLLIFGTTKDRCIAAAACTTGLGAIVLWYKSALTHNLQDTWLSGFPPGIEGLRAPFVDLLSYFQGGAGFESMRKLLYFPLAFGTAAILWILSKKDEPSRTSISLLLLCVLSALGGPLIYDLLRDMHTCVVSRYTLSGMPLLFVLIGWLLQRTPMWLKCSSLALIAAIWFTGWQLALNDERTALCRSFALSLKPQDVVLLPNDNLVLARYLPANCAVIGCGRRLSKASTVNLVDLLSKYNRVFVAFGKDTAAVSKALGREYGPTAVSTMGQSVADSVQVYQRQRP
jgi:hypothetical protein